MLPTTQSGSTASQSSESNLKVQTAKETEEKSEISSEEENCPVEKSTQPVCYGRELWDCIPVLERNTKERTMQMKALKEMIDCIRQGFDNF